MDGYGFNLALVGMLVLVNAAFSGSEIALISLRDGQLAQLEREGGSRARALLRLSRNPNRFLATIQIGITLAGFLASATAAVSLARPVAGLLSVLGTAADAVAIALVTVVLTFLTLVVGELAPKRLAMQKSLPWALLVSRPLDLLAAASRPAVWALSASTDVVVRVFGGRTDAGGEQLSPEELRDLVAGHRGLNAEQRRIIVGALEIHERILRRVLVPRRSVFTLHADLPLHEACLALAASGRSRAPVVRSNDLDDVVGLVSLRDLMPPAPAPGTAGPATAGDVVRPVVTLPDTVRVSDALRRFKADRHQFALVADEHGSIEGIVTLEDLLEEIVGEIYDETDDDVMTVSTGVDGSMLLPGTFPVHDLVDLGVEIEDAPHGDYSTVAGLVLARLGRIPQAPGDVAVFRDWCVEVTRVEGRAITGVRLRRSGAA